MFDSISQSLQSVFARLGKGGRLTEKNIQEGLREIRQALLEADVNFKVAKDLIASVTERAVGEKVIESIRPAQQIVKIFHDVLTEAMEGGGPLPFAAHPPTVVMLAGLQGSGKTTTAGKLAHLLRRKGRNPLLVAADLQRPGAVDQLRILGEKVGVPVYNPPRLTPPEVCQSAVPHARASGRDVVILDTAGRLHIDEPLMAELAEVKKRAAPHHVYFVCDAMTGQDAVNSAKTFHERLGLDGVILTKLDGDTRGGAAISIRQVTGAPIRYVGVGEKLENLEEFHAERLASRILGMGDVVSLVEKAQDVIDQDAAERQVEKLLNDEFTLEDFLYQLRATKKLGPLKDVLGMLPGMGAQLKDMNIDEKALDHVEAMVCSMTPEERLRPDVLNGARRRRIARGSGTSVEQVNHLVRQFSGMRQMMKQMKSGGLLGRLAGKMLPGGGAGLARHKAAAVAGLRSKGKLVDRSRRKQERSRRKANRRRR
ncbi:MAG: signal recognition particle protein [Planctomycetes bacterium]|nr:signal recognition particle protein [Planctomycetota bacterium]